MDAVGLRAGDELVGVADMSFEAEEPYDVHRKTIRRAIKEHTCEACKCVIRPGEHYAHVATVYDGSAETFKRCGRCEAIHTHLQDIGARHGAYPMERLDCGQSYEDEWGTCPDDIAALAFMTEAEAGKLLERRRALKSESEEGS